MTESEGIITIIDDSGREKAEKVAYSVKDVFGDKVCESLLLCIDGLV